MHITVQCFKQASFNLILDPKSGETWPVESKVTHAKDVSHNYLSESQQPSAPPILLVRKSVAEIVDLRLRLQ